jgi:hypothetical protein
MTWNMEEQGRMTRNMGMTWGTMWRMTGNNMKSDMNMGRMTWNMGNDMENDMEYGE